MNRQQALLDFHYPAFQEDANQLCLRWIRGDRAQVTLKQKDFRGQTYSWAPQVRIEFGKVQTRSFDLPATAAAGYEPARAEKSNQGADSGQCDSIFSESVSLLQENDWVGIRLNFLGQIEKLQLLSPELSLSPSLPQVPKEILLQWNQFLKSVRQFFEDKNFLEVNTPTLVTCPGTEPYLDVFTTKFQRGRESRNLSLPTSPELHLKKLLAAGYGPLFEIRTCFRNGEISEHHQPEFWMIEWYRPGQNLEAIQQDCQDLVNFCARQLKVPAPNEVHITSMAELFQRQIQFNLTPQTTAAELKEKARKFQIPISDDTDFDDAFFLLFLEKIERKIPTDQLTFLKNYPPSQAALARLTADGWGDRFEMYWKGMELANAYHELNDPKTQRERSNEDQKKRQHLGRPAVELDEQFFQSLESGAPPSAGIALGLERLFMALTDRKSLEEIRLFPMK